MTIDIQEPELETLIAQRMATGQFESVQDFLLKALRSAPTAETLDLEDATGELIITAMQRSPHKDIDIEPPPYYPPVRDVVL